MEDNAAQASSTSSKQTANPKKRRNPNACELCRTKKVKCDSSSMPGGRCTECIAFNWECVKPKKKTIRHYIPTPQPTFNVNIQPRPSPPTEHPHPQPLTFSAPSQTSTVGNNTLHPLIEEVLSLLPEVIAPSATLALSRVSCRLMHLEKENTQLKANAGYAEACPPDSGSIFINNTPSLPTSSSTFPPPPPLIERSDDGDEENISSSSSSTKSIQLKLAELHIQPGKEGKHYGASSTMALVGMALKVILESNKNQDIVPDLRGIRRATYWSVLPWETDLDLDPQSPLHTFPPPSLLHHLTALFFKEINVLLPLLHLPTFLSSLNSNLHILDPQFGEVVLLVCANAARWCEDERVLLEGDDVGHSAGWKWFRQVRLFGGRERYKGRPEVWKLQANILSALYIGGSSQPELAWVLLGLGIRYAVEVGAHRKRTSQVTAEGELWKRAFWIIWCYDGLMSSFMGRPRATLSDDFDVDLPVECDDEYWETENPEERFLQPEDKPSTISAFISFIKLIKISEYAQTNLFSIRATKEIASGKRNAQDIVAHLDSELNRWQDSVPAHLRWSNYHDLDHCAYSKLDPETAVFYRQATLLQTTYHHIHILAHRAFIFTSTPESPMFSTSWAVCANAARACFKTLRAYQPFTTVHFTMVAASVILLLEKWKVGKGRGNASSSARQSVVECLNFLTECETRWVGAGKLVDVLRELLHLDDLVSNPGNSPSRAFSGSQPTTPSLKPEDIFSIATESFPTVDLDFLGRTFFGTGEECFSMLF